MGVLDEPSQRYQTNSNDVSFIEPYECPEPVVPETEVLSDQNGQTDHNDQNDPSVQNDEILRAGMLTRAMAKELGAASAHERLFIDFISEEEPKKISEEIQHLGWVDAMQDKLNQFARNKVWTLVPAPYGKTIIGSKWANDFPTIIKLDKALYGLKQASRAWYETLSTFLTEHKFERVKTPMVPPNKLGPDLNGKTINETQYRGMIESLMYLTVSRPDIQFSTCLYARYQANPKESYLIAVKGIFRYLKGTPRSWSMWLKKQQSVAMSSAEAEYVAAAGCCANILWMKSQLTDYDIIYEKVPIFCDNTSAIAILNNPALHSRTKHIDIRYHFIRGHILKGVNFTFLSHSISTCWYLHQPMDEPTFKRLIVELGMLNIDSKLEASVLIEEN
ncbi:retrovirus-related pol polyprotein from transposon TNT 1-94 [Tanacetum coccineum]